MNHYISNALVISPPFTTDHIEAHTFDDALQTKLSHANSTSARARTKKTTSYSKISEVIFNIVGDWTTIMKSIKKALFSSKYEVRAVIKIHIENALPDSSINICLLLLSQNL